MPTQNRNMNKKLLVFKLFTGISSVFILSALSISVWAKNYLPLLTPLPAFTAKDIAIIVNDADPLSLRIGQYYQLKRNIPGNQVIHIKFNPGIRTLSANQFINIKKQVDTQTPKHVQAFVLTWMQPYRVGCMSITTAFAAGYDEAFCAKGCKPTRTSPYFNSNSNKPFAEYGWRPTMSLAGENFAAVKALIDRGIAADYTIPKGTAYLLKTSDKSRSTRAVFYANIQKIFSGLFEIHLLEKDFIANKKDVMFYFTGLPHVPKINTNQYLPGAVADHLTSTGGMLSGSKQMSSIQWLKAGATGSYGAVNEPCNYTQKFPNPGVMLFYYLRGNSLIEAYWKSVAWPGQGIFIGEPLAKPFAYRDHTTTGTDPTP
jgi:uncharacterized protein (TIGR03790 family)